MTIQLLPDGREVKIKLAMESSPDESVKKTLSFNFFKKNLFNESIYFLYSVCVERGAMCPCTCVCGVCEHTCEGQRRTSDLLLHHCL